MKVTGERFIPGRMAHDGEIEHFHRYTAVQRIVRDKIVLDAACGTGYGSRILAQTAQKVYAMDLSAEAVEYARENYGNEHIEYLQGSVEQLPFENASLDVVVSFETIEHVDGKVQKKFLQEIYRVLKEDGLLIMSSPNKKLFTDERNLITEFHVKEFYEKEFLSFIGEIFPHYRIYNQFFSKVSNIICENGEKLTPINYDYQRKGLFFVAIASKKHLNPEVKLDSCYYYPEEYARCNDYLQVYYGKTNVFLEADSITHDISNAPGVINETIDLENMEGRYFRIDPNNTSCTLIIKNVIFVLKEGQYIEHLDFTTNADLQKDNCYTFLSRDPQIVFDLGTEQCVRSITVQLEVVESNIDLYSKYFSALGENQIQTKKNAQLDNRNQELQKLLLSERKRREDLERQNKELIHAKEQLDRLNHSIKKQNEELAKEREQKDKLNYDIKKQNEELALERDLKDKELNDVKVQYQLLQEHNDMLREARNTEQKTFSALQNTNTELEALNKELREKLSLLQEDAIKQRNESEQIMAELAMVKKKAWYKFFHLFS